MLIFSRDNLTDTPRSNILTTIWASLSPVKLTRKINHHRLKGELEKEDPQMVKAAVTTFQKGRINDCNDHSPLLETSEISPVWELRIFLSLLQLLIKTSSLYYCTPSSVCQVSDNLAFLPLFLPWLSIHAFASPPSYLECPCFSSYWAKCLVSLSRHHSHAVDITAWICNIYSCTILGPVSSHTPTNTITLFQLLNEVRPLGAVEKRKLKFMYVLYWQS